MTAYEAVALPRGIRFVLGHPPGLAQRVLAREHALLVQSIGAIAGGRVRLSADAIFLGEHPLAMPLQLSPTDQLEECA